MISAECLHGIEQDVCESTCHAARPCSFKLVWLKKFPLDAVFLFGSELKTLSVVVRVRSAFNIESAILWMSTHLVHQALTRRCGADPVIVWT